MSSPLAGIGPVLVVDLAAVSLTRSADRSLMTVTAGSRLLGVCRCDPDSTDAQAAFAALEEVTSSSLVDVDSPYGPGQVKARIAWLNPFTSAVSAGTASDGWVFCDFAPLPLDEECVVGLVKADFVHSRVLVVAGRTLPARPDPAMADVTTELLAHQ